MAADDVSMPQRAVPPPLPAAPLPDCGLRGRLVAGLLLSLLLVFGVGGWAATAKLSGAVIAAGLVVVDSNVKKVQHPHGGVVGQLLVRNGDRVAAGDVLVRLDDTQIKAALGVVLSQLVELTGRSARLIAERDGAAAITFAPGFENLAPDAARAAEGEARLFAARRSTAESQKEQFRTRIGQLAQEIEGVISQRDAKAHELQLVRLELSRVRDMYKRRLTPVTRVLAMERDETRIAGEHGALVAQIARAQAQIGETELQILNVDQTRQSEAQRELREVEARIAELAERRTAAEDQLRRIELRAPIAGVVHELGVHTVGGVVSAGEQVMLIVPSSEELTVEVRVAPSDIDQVEAGQKSILRFPAFNQRTTPEVAGALTRVAADLTRETQTGQAFYLARIRVDDAAIAGLGSLKLVPGMPVEAFIETGERTALSYLVKPFTDQFARAFREE